MLNYVINTQNVLIIRSLIKIMFIELLVILGYLSKNRK
jgi:hypothetical protein